jgi:hypothetical protein
VGGLVIGPQVLCRAMIMYRTRHEQLVCVLHCFSNIMFSTRREVEGGRGGGPQGH